MVFREPHTRLARRGTRYYRTDVLIIISASSVIFLLPTHLRGMSVDVGGGDESLDILCTDAHGAL